MSRAVLTIAALLALALPAVAQKAAGSGPGNSNKPINIKAAKLDYFDKERKLIYTGDVIAIQGDSTLKATVLTILLMPKAPDVDGKPAGGGSSNQVKVMYAKGPVTILQPGQVGTGDAGVFDKVTNVMTLTGNVTWSQGPNVTKGDKLVYNMTSGQALVTGQGKGVVSMFEPENSTPAPAAASDASAPAKPATKRRAKTAKSGG